MFHIKSTKDLVGARDGEIVKVAGLVLVRQRPGTAGGVCFITIEDETGVANLVVFRNLFESKYRKEIISSCLLMAEGKVQKEGQVIHVIVTHCADWSKLLRYLTDGNARSSSFKTLSDSGNNMLPFNAEDKQTQVRVKAGEDNFPGARDFR